MPQHKYRAHIGARATERLECTEDSEVSGGREEGKATTCQRLHALGSTALPQRRRKANYKGWRVGVGGKYADLLDGGHSKLRRWHKWRFVLAGECPAQLLPRGDSVRLQLGGRTPLILFVACEAFLGLLY